MTNVDQVMLGKANIKGVGRQRRIDIKGCFATGCQRQLENANAKETPKSAKEGFANAFSRTDSAYGGGR